MYPVGLKSKDYLFWFNIKEVDLWWPDCDFPGQTNMLFRSVTPESASGKPWLKVLLTFCSSSIYVGRFFSSLLLLFTENQALILDNTQDAEDKHGNIFAPLLLLRHQAGPLIDLILY